MTNLASTADVTAAGTADELVTKNVVDRTFGLGRSSGTSWNVHAEWLAGERLDPDRLVAAAAATMWEHPLLSARHGTSEMWVAPAEPSPPVVERQTAGDDATLAALRERAVNQRFALQGEPPVRFHVVHAPDGDHVLVVADHALVDGVGIGRTAVSLIAAYATGSPAGRTSRDDTWREAHALAVASPPPGRVRQTVLELERRALPTAVRLAPEQVSSEPGGGGGDGCGVVYRDLSAVAAGALASLPRGPWTVNDVILAGFCQAGMRWNRLAGRPPVPFTVGVPLNLRPARSWFDGVCNATLLWPVRVDAGAPGEVPEPGEVLGQMSEQLRPVRSGLYSTEVRAVLAHLAGRPALSVRQRHALATTTVVSTVPGADVARADLPAPMATAPIYGGMPAPPVMGMTFAVLPDRGTYRLSARYLHARHTAAGAARYLSWVDSAVTRLCDLVATRAPTEVTP